MRALSAWNAIAMVANYTYVVYSGCHKLLHDVLFNTQPHEGCKDSRYVIHFSPATSSTVNSHVNSIIVFCFQQVFQFLNGKCEAAFLSKRNPRQINWTVLYRRKHKKGQSVSQVL